MLLVTVCSVSVTSNLVAGGTTKMYPYDKVIAEALVEIRDSLKRIEEILTSSFVLRK